MDQTFTFTPQQLLIFALLGLAAFLAVAVARELSAPAPRPSIRPRPAEPQNPGDFVRGINRMAEDFAGSAITQFVGTHFARNLVSAFTAPEVRRFVEGDGVTQTVEIGSGPLRTSVDVAAGDRRENKTRTVKRR